MAISFLAFPLYLFLLLIFGSPEFRSSLSIHIIKLLHSGDHNQVLILNLALFTHSTHELICNMSQKP